MKKAKIVLTAIAILGIAGGAMAFKAKARFGGVTYYTTTVQNAPAPNTLLNARTTAAGTGVVRYYTLIHNAPAVVSSFVTTGI